MSYKRKEPNDLSIQERINLLGRRYWTNEQIMDFTGLKMHAVFKLRKEIKAKNKDAISHFNTGWVSTDYVIRLVFLETREQHLNRLIEFVELQKRIGVLPINNGDSKTERSN